MPSFWCTNPQCEHSFPATPTASVTECPRCGTPVVDDLADLPLYYHDPTRACDLLEAALDIRIPDTVKGDEVTLRLMLRAIDTAARSARRAVLHGLAEQERRRKGHGP